MLYNSYVMKPGMVGKDPLYACVFRMYGQRYTLIFNHMGCRLM
jgi:hypothetical protein